MKKTVIFLRVFRTCATIGMFALGCSSQNPVNTIPGTTAPSVTTFPDNREFIRGSNNSLLAGGHSGLDLNGSFQKWLEYKNTEGHTYIYYISFSSWTGHGSSYQVVVSQDSIARIVITEYRTIISINSPTKVTDTLSHRELPTDSAGYYHIMTVDNMYTYAQDSVMTRDTATNTIYFNLFENGILNQCQYYPHGCMDDCTIGVSIDSLFFGEIR